MDEQRQFRQQLMIWRLGKRDSPPSSTTPRDLDNTIPVLRDCGSHVVQAYLTEFRDVLVQKVIVASDLAFEVEKVAKSRLWAAPHSTEIPFTIKDLLKVTRYYYPISARTLPNPTPKPTTMRDLVKLTAENELVGAMGYNYDYLGATSATIKDPNHHGVPTVSAREIRL
ncbi:hypothetical protein ACHAPT_006711 [Fusarium lateritium]